jgi:hypothetical protein
MQSLQRRARLAMLLVAIGLVAPAALKAQSMYFGLAGGATLSDLSGDTRLFDGGDRWGGTFGLVLGYRTADRMILSLEPGWTQMGGRDGGIDYTEVPLLIGYLGETGDRTRFGPYGGIMPAFKLDCGLAEPASACGDAKGSPWFIPLGARFYHEIGSGNFLGIDARYSWPLGSSFEKVDVKQRSWAFRLVFVRGEM